MSHHAAGVKWYQILTHHDNLYTDHFTQDAIGYSDHCMINVIPD